MWWLKRTGIAGWAILAGVGYFLYRFLLDTLHPSPTVREIKSKAAEQRRRVEKARGRKDTDWLHKNLTDEARKARKK